MNVFRLGGGRGWSGGRRPQVRKHFLSWKPDPWARDHEASGLGGRLFCCSLSFRSPAREVAVRPHPPATPSRTVGMGCNPSSGTRGRRGVGGQGRGSTRKEEGVRAEPGVPRSSICYCSARVGRPGCSSPGAVSVFNAFGPASLKRPRTQGPRAGFRSPF